MPTYDVQSGQMFPKWRQLLSLTHEQWHLIYDINMKVKSSIFDVCLMCQVARLAARYSLRISSNSDVPLVRRGVSNDAWTATRMPVTVSNC